MEDREGPWGIEVNGRKSGIGECGLKVSRVPKEGKNTSNKTLRSEYVMYVQEEYSKSDMAMRKGYIWGDVHRMYWQGIEHACSQTIKHTY